ncbi:MAG: hypothetical protein C0518_00940 [Opitutus sp.]|nr:hypothetical protein [Opitutus sp.]
MKIGLIPFGGDTNPYQELTRRALVAQGLDVRTFPKSNWLPLWRAAQTGVEVLHLDWPHSFYMGAGPVQSAIKRTQFLWQLSHLDGVKLVWTVHNLQSHDSAGRAEPELEWLARRVDALVSLSQKGVDLIHRRWPVTATKPITVIPLGHFADWYNTGLQKDEARQVLGVPVGAKLAVFAGRLQPYKGLELLIPAFQKVARQNEWLLLAGEPSSAEYTERLRTLIKGHPRVIFQPRLLDRAELGQAIATSDFAVFPFKEIFNSASVVLALSFGKPVVAPARGSLDEVIPQEAWFSMGQGSPGELEAALWAAFRADDLPARGLIAARKMRIEHSWSIVGERLASMYFSLGVKS